jgi:WD40 repeat protein
MIRTSAWALLLLGAGLAGAAEPEPKADDQLPPGAVARLGSTRLRHPGRSISQLTFSPDHKLLATAGDGPFVALWDTSDGKQVKRLHASDDRGAVAGGAAWSADGKLFAAGGQGEIAVWETDGWKERFRLPIDGRPGPAAFSADGKTLVVVDQRDKPPFALCTFAADTGKELRRTLIKRGAAAALSPDGRWLAVADAGLVLLFRAETGEEEAQLTPGGPGKPIGPRAPEVGFTADGKFLAFTGPDGVVVWDLEAGKETAAIKIAYVGGAQAVALLPDGKRVATFGRASGPDGKPAPDKGEFVFAVHDVAGKSLHQAASSCDPGAAAGAVRAAASADGALVAGACGNAVELWDAAEGTRNAASASGPASAPAVMRFSPDGATALAFSADEGVVRLWDAEKGALRKAIHGKFTCAALSPDGKLTATGGEAAAPGKEGVVTLWDADGKEVAVLPKVHHSRVEFVGFADEGRTLISTDVQSQTAVWDVAKQEKVKEAPGAGQKVLGVAADGKTALAVIGARPGLWDLTEAKRVNGILPPSAPGYRLLLAPDGKTLVGQDPERQTVFTWDLAAGAYLLPALPARAPKSAGLALSADGKLLAVSDDSAEAVRLWDLTAGRARGVVKTGQPGVVELALSADGKRLLTAGRDGSLLVWDVNQAGPPEKPPVVERTPAELQDLWAGLSGGPGAAGEARAYKAMWDLVESGPPAVALLREQVKPVDPKLKVPPPGTGRESARIQMLVGILEYQGSDEARKFLEELAAGHPGAGLTKAAKAALDRLDQRKP